MRKAELIFHDGDKKPSVKQGQMEAFLVTILRRDTMRPHTFTAVYLNRYPLHYEEPEHECQVEGCQHEDSCKTSGWYQKIESDGEYEQIYRKILNNGDPLIEWAEIPQHPDASPIQPTTKAA